MPVMDEFKAERAAMKDATPKQKLAYFWDYYKWYVIGGCAAIAAITSFIWQVATRKDVALYALLLNGMPLDQLADESENSADFAQYAGIDESVYEIVYDTSAQLGSSNDYFIYQKLMANLAARELDIFVSDAESLITYAYQENFHDLRDFLSPEQAERYEPSFYYIDGALMRDLNAAREKGDYDSVPEYGDPSRPETMREPVPVGIYLPKDCPLLSQYIFRGDPAVCVVINTQRAEQALKFVEFLCGREEPVP